MSVYPFITFCVAVAVCLFFYEINKNMETQIQKELEGRR
jgi:Na+/melibiose symporter-like transporter